MNIESAPRTVGAGRVVADRAIVESFYPETFFVVSAGRISADRAIVECLEIESVASIEISYSV